MSNFCEFERGISKPTSAAECGADSQSLVSLQDMQEFSHLFAAKSAGNKPAETGKIDPAAIKAFGKAMDDTFPDHVPETPKYPPGHTWTNEQISQYFHVPPVPAGGTVERVPNENGGIDEVMKDSQGRKVGRNSDLHIPGRDVHLHQTFDPATGKVIDAGFIESR